MSFSDEFNANVVETKQSDQFGVSFECFIKSPMLYEIKYVFLIFCVWEVAWKTTSLASQFLSITTPMWFQLLKAIFPCDYLCHILAWTRILKCTTERKSEIQWVVVTSAWFRKELWVFDFLYIYKSCRSNWALKFLIGQSSFKL